ncbi:diatom-specific cyclin [Seminavis robusta]|uniref:Diatom-specific cyclin n=1 Tax=Seminavis robusta TaxID=568900 RepID=A0A9N8HD42_9STRA|nr:diatom-specific cyclin [Seminavis robusta]|eukprot:Sro245_g097390.1 diatom-specific cyclin (345) ;mRNA; r:41004-42038
MGSDRMMTASLENDERSMKADTLRAMLKQEASGHYACLDYLSMTPWNQDVYRISKPGQEYRMKHDSGPETRIDEYCREQIVEWSFRVVDYFRIDREVVSLSISFLDRFLSKCRCDRTSFKLAATTTLSLAVKLLYPCKLGELGILSDLSRGEFDMVDVADMESYILRSLSWHMHPPTPVAFATLFLDFIFGDFAFDVSEADLDDIYDVSSFFCDLAVCDYYFVPVKASTVALAAVENALEGMFGQKNRLEMEVLRAAKKVGLYRAHDLSAARNRLWELYERSEECALHNQKATSDEQPVWNGGVFVKKVSTHYSPVSISTSCASGNELSHPTKHANLIRNNTSW